MKLPIKWLTDYTPIPTDEKEFERRLISTGTAVEGVSPVAEFSGVVIGRVLSCVAHENSDHLHVCKVDVGGEATLQIVCGAPNVKEGLLVPVATVGALLPGGHEIKKGKLRGVESEGMLCSSTELNIPQELYPSIGDAGLLIFNEEYAPGTDVRDILNIAGYSAEFEILANRPDCLCALGIAREAAAAYDKPFKMPDLTVTEAGGDIHDFVRVSVKDDALCPRYASRVIKNVRVAPSPLWLRARLHACGMRSINNIVDITNYVMLETGHPMHAFDLDKVRGREIIVRRAKENETLRTLDGKDRELCENDLLICDRDGPTGLAGVMGGEESEITESTREIMFECATFDRAAIRVTARRLGIRTESSGRFERGVSARTIMTALDRACHLVSELNAGDVVGGAYDLYPNPLPVQVITASCERISRLAGVKMSPELIADMLTRLSFAVSRDGDRITATVPDFRQDVDGEADLCEEALRLYGYQHIPSTSLRGEGFTGGRSERMYFSDKIRDLLSGLGAWEAMTYSFISRKTFDLLNLAPDDPRRDALSIRNPLGEDTAVMRTLLSGDMLRVLATNMNRGNAGIRLYEIGAAFDIARKNEEGLPLETQTLCLGMYGESEDFYSLRDVLLALCGELGVSANVVPGGEVFHHPGRSARLMHGGTQLAVLGEVHPAVAEKYELPGRALVAEMNLDLLRALSKPMGTVKPLPRTPAVSRDLALVMKKDQPLGDVLETIRKAGGALLEDACLFDVFTGIQVGPGNKSAAFALTFRSPDHTLTDDEIKKVMDKIESAAVHKHGATLRG